MTYSAAVPPASRQEHSISFEKDSELDRVLPGKDGRIVELRLDEPG